MIDRICPVCGEKDILPGIELIIISNSQELPCISKIFGTVKIDGGAVVKCPLKDIMFIKGFREEDSYIATEKEKK